jgi:uncharacterized protein (DUF4415 family)
MSKLPENIERELKALDKIRDEDIDYSDIPETTDWSNPVRGRFYRPIKKSVTVRLDADVLAWLKSKGEGYQTRLNAMLRQMMERDA